MHNAYVKLLTQSTPFKIDGEILALPNIGLVAPFVGQGIAWSYRVISDIAKRWGWDLKTAQWLPGGPKGSLRSIEAAELRALRHALTLTKTPDSAVVRKATTCDWEHKRDYLRSTLARAEQTHLDIIMSMLDGNIYLTLPYMLKNNKHLNRTTANSVLGRADDEGVILNKRGGNPRGYYRPDKVRT